MSERTERFTVGEEPRFDVTLPSGSVLVTPGDEGAITVTVRGSDLDRVQVEQRGDAVYVTVDRSSSRWDRRSYEVVAAVPASAEVAAKLASADLSIETDVAGLDAALSSGDLRARNVAGDVRVKVASGDMRLDAVGGRLAVSGASGDLRADSAGEADVSLASGDVHIGRVAGRCQVNTAAGDVRIGSFDGEVCDCKTLSGDVWLGIPPGRRLNVEARTLSGDVRSLFEGEPSGTEVERVTATVRVKSMAGDVLLAPAQAS